MNEADRNRILLAIAQGRATPSERAELEHDLIGVLQAKGPQGLMETLESLPSFSFAAGESTQDGAYAFTGRREGYQVVVSGFASAALASVDVSVPSAAEERPSPDPRHDWFYRRWESLMGIDDEVAARLSEGDRAVFLVALLEAEVMNGGLGQYLTNTDGVWADHTLSVLDEIGAVASRDVLSAALVLSRKEATMVRAWDRHAQELSRLDDRFVEAGEDLAGLTADRFMSSTP